MSTSVTVGTSDMADKHNPARAVPVRIKKKTLKKLTNAERLEVENAKMEERLRLLRQTIEKEKQERSAQPHGYLWKSGQPGAITTHAKEHSRKNKSAGVKLGEKRIKVKFLTPVSEKSESREKRAAPRVSTPHNSSTTAGTSWAEPQTSPRDDMQSRDDIQQSAVQQSAEQQQSTAQQSVVQRVPRETMAWSDVARAEEEGIEGIQRQASVVGPVCGQCEINGAQMNCLECGEKYCSACFAMFHKKGALKSHTSRPLTRLTNLNPGPRVVTVESSIYENTLWGDYDEAASAQSFADAVKAWRIEDSSVYTGNHEHRSARKTTDGSQTSTNSMPDINFSENQNVSYFERMMLKKERNKALEDDVNSEYSAGEITVSQLDFCRDLLAHNLEEDRKSRMEPERPESAVEIVEVNSNIGYLEETVTCVIEEDPDSSDEDDLHAQLQLARQLLSTVKIEEYLPHQLLTSHNPTTAGIFQQNTDVGETAEQPLATPLPPSTPPARQSTTSLRNDVATVTAPRVVTPPQAITPPRTTTPTRAITPPRSRQPRTPKREEGMRMSPPKVDRAAVQDPTRSSIVRAGRVYTETVRSPLIRRIPTNPEIARTSVAKEKVSGDTVTRPDTADVLILSSQAWKQSFIGFVKAGLPGYTLPVTPPPHAEEEEQAPVMLRGPPTWCPGESRTDNEIFQSRENTVTFSLSGDVKLVTNVSKQPSPPAKKTGNFKKGDEKTSDMVRCDDLNDSSELEYDSKDVLDALGRELSVSRSRDLGDYLTTLRIETPDPMTLLTHEDRMSQLDLESRGMTPTATPLIARLTTRDSLFLDFEDVEKQIMAGEDVDDLQ